MKVNRVELQKALEMVKPALASKEIIEQSTSFAFLDGVVATYNDEISISHPVVGLNIRGAIKANELYQFINKTSREEIDIECEEAQILIKAGRAKAGFILQSEITLPTEEIGEIGKWKKLPANFVEGLRFCNPTCSKDMSRPIITCVHLNGNGFIESSDGYRLSRFALESSLPITEALIPSTSITELIKFEITKMAQGNGWVHFKTEAGTIFSCRIFEDEYPPIEEIISFPGELLELPKSLNLVLDRAAIFAKTEFDMDSLVTINIVDGVMEVKADGNSSWFEEVMRTKYKGEAIHFKTNPAFLSAMLGKVESCIFGQGRIRFESASWKHVIALTVGDAE